MPFFVCVTFSGAKSSSADGELLLGPLVLVFLSLLLTKILFAAIQVPNNVRLHYHDEYPSHLL